MLSNIKFFLYKYVDIRIMNFDTNMDTEQIFFQRVRYKGLLPISYHTVDICAPNLKTKLTH